MSDLSENKVVLPTNVSTFDRNRQHSVVFYGRVSTEHEAQLAALENQMQWYEDQAKYHPNWTVLKSYIDRGNTGTQAKKRPAFMEMLNDAKFDKYDCVKEIQSDGSMLYTGNPEKDYYTCMVLANITLKRQKWFGKYCKKWVMLDNEDDETLPLQNIDILARQRQTNPLFAV